MVGWKNSLALVRVHSFFLSFGQAMGEDRGTLSGVIAQPVLGMSVWYPSWFETCWDHLFEDRG